MQSWNAFALGCNNEASAHLKLCTKHGGTAEPFACFAAHSTPDASFAMPLCCWFGGLANYRARVVIRVRRCDKTPESSSECGAVTRRHSVLHLLQSGDMSRQCTFNHLKESSIKNQHRSTEAL